MVEPIAPTANNAAGAKSCAGLNLQEVSCCTILCPHPLTGRKNITHSSAAIQTDLFIGNTITVANVLISYLSDYYCNLFFAIFV